MKYKVGDTLIGNEQNIYRITSFKSKVIVTSSPSDSDVIEVEVIEPGVTIDSVHAHAYIGQLHWVEERYFDLFICNKGRC